MNPVRRAYNRVRGDWEPGNFDPWVTLSGKIILYIVMAVWGVDYLSPESTEALSRLTLVEAALPIQIWGWALITASVLGFLGVAFAITPFIAWAHVAGGALFLAIGGGTFITQITRDPDIDLGTSLALIAAGVVTVFVTHHLYKAHPQQPRAWLGALGIGTAVILCGIAVDVDTFRSAVLGLSFGVLHLIMATGTMIQDRRQTLLRERGVAV